MSCTNITTPLSAEEMQMPPWTAPGLDISNPEHRKMIRHLYSRIGYGASYTDLLNANGKTIDQLVDSIINGAENVAFPANIDWTSRFVERAIYDTNGNKKLTVRDIANLLRNYWINESITEAVKSKLTLFWRNHFVTEEAEFTTYSHQLRYYKTIFSNAFGDFKEFVKKMGREPLMLNYLDGAKSYGEPNGIYEPGEEPNENYARELLELFTMGISYQGEDNYDDIDIKELSRIFSGWRVGEFNWNSQNNPFSFRPALPNESGVKREVWTTSYSPTSDGIYNHSMGYWTYQGPANDIDIPESGELNFTYGHHDWADKTLFDEPIEPASILDNEIFDATTFGTNHCQPLEEVMSNPASRYNSIPGVIGTPLQNHGSVIFPAIDPTTYQPAIDPDTGDAIKINDENLDTIVDTIHIKRVSQYGTAYAIRTTTNRGLGFLTAANKEYNQTHDIIFQKKANAIGYFICKKMYEFYIYGGLETIQDNTLRSNIDLYIEDLATEFKDSNWSIKAVLRKLFKSQHFYDAAIMGTDIKSHIGSAVSLFRLSELTPGWGTWDAVSNNYDYVYRFELLDPTLEGQTEPNNNPNYLDKHGNPIPINALTGEGGTPTQNVDGKALRDASHTIKIQKEAGLLGQNLAAPPDVAGWPGHRTWLNQFTLISRQNLLNLFLNSLPHDQPPMASDDPPPLGFTLETKRKFRLLAQNVFDIVYPGDDYTDHEKVVRALWEHFFFVTPYEEFAADGTTRIGQIGGALDAYLVGCDGGNCYTPNISQDTAFLFHNSLKAN